MPKIEVTSDALAIAADRGYLPNVTNFMWSAAADLPSRSLAPPGTAADLPHVQGRLAHRLGALAQVVQVLLDPEQVRVRKLIGHRQRTGLLITVGNGGIPPVVPGIAAAARAGPPGTARAPATAACGGPGRHRLPRHGRRHHCGGRDLGQLARSRTAPLP